MRCIRGMRIVRLAALAAAISSALAIGATPAQAWTYKTLYKYTGGKDGSVPSGGLLRDAATGDLYGVTAGGGNDSCGYAGGGCGVIYRLTAKGKLTVLHTFSKAEEGLYPAGGLVKDEFGNLYGTTSRGGQPGCSWSDGCGGVFKLAPDRTYTVLHIFNESDGHFPLARLARDSATGDLFGTTYYGGSHLVGAVFKLAADGTYTLLHSFGGPITDGMLPLSAVTFDHHGNLYGTTFEGGEYGDCRSDGCGLVYKLAPDGTETVLHAFSSPKNARPYGSLARDQAGNFYGTNMGQSGRRGVVFKITPKGAFKVIHAFNKAEGGLVAPAGDLVLDAAGNIYGTAEGGGAKCCGGVFQIGADGSEQALYNFDARPGAGGLISDDSGNLYGTLENGGTGHGTVYELAKD